MTTQEELELTPSTMTLEDKMKFLINLSLEYLDRDKVFGSWDEVYGPVREIVELQLLQFHPEIEREANFSRCSYFPRCFKKWFFDCWKQRYCSGRTLSGVGCKRKLRDHQMPYEKNKYGFYSASMDELMGHNIHQKLIGNEIVKITFFDNNKEGSNYNWDDKIYVGEVGDLLESHLKGETKNGGMNAVD